MALNLTLSRKYCSSNVRHVHTPTVHNLGTLQKSQSCVFFVVCMHVVTARSSTHMLRSTEQPAKGSGRADTDTHPSCKSSAPTMLPRAET